MRLAWHIVLALAFTATLSCDRDNPPPPPPTQAPPARPVAPASPDRASAVPVQSATPVALPPTPPPRAEPQEWLFDPALLTPPGFELTSAERSFVRGHGTRYDFSFSGDPGIEEASQFYFDLMARESWQNSAIAESSSGRMMILYFFKYKNDNTKKDINITLERSGARTEISIIWATHPETAPSQVLQDLIAVLEAPYRVEDRFNRRNAATGLEDFVSQSEITVPVLERVAIHDPERWTRRRAFWSLAKHARANNQQMRQRALRALETAKRSDQDSGNRQAAEEAIQIFRRGGI